MDATYGRWQNLLESGSLNDLIEWASCAAFHPPPLGLLWNVTQMRNTFLLVKPPKFGSIIITAVTDSGYLAVSSKTEREVKMRNSGHVKFEILWENQMKMSRGQRTEAHGVIVNACKFTCVHGLK